MAFFKMDFLQATTVALLCALTIVVATELHPLSDAFIDHINSKQMTWKAGRNFPSNTPLKHIRRLVGDNPKSKVNSLPIIEHSAELISKLPDSFDARKKWPNCLSLNKIRDQGSCGSCWAFSATETMTDRFCIYSNGAKQFHFSAQDLVTCCGSFCGDCDGGSPDLALIYWKVHGLVSGGNYNSHQGCRPYSISNCIQHDPYSYRGLNGQIKLCSDYLRFPKTPKCMKKCAKNYKVSYKNDKQYGKEIYSVKGDEAHLKAEIFLNGPVIACFDVYSDFFSYKSGVYRHVAGHFVYGHAVKILGRGEENGTKYWLVANSWNTKWGDNGFFKIIRGENHLGIENDTISGEPLLTDA